MRTTIITAALAITITAATSPAHADRCDDLTARLIAATGATLADTKDEWRHFYHPLAGGHPMMSRNALSLNCKDRPMIGVDSYGTSPSQAFLDFAGRAGAVVTPDDAALVSAALSRCYEQFVQKIK